MRHIFDRFGKQLLKDSLSEIGEAKTELEVVPDAKRVDVWFCPREGCEKERQALGLLGEMTRGPCVIEAYHKAVGQRAFDSCLLKHLAVGDQRRRAKLTPATMWIVSAGFPVQLLGSLPWRHGGRLGSGTYEYLGLRGIGLVASSRLPRTRYTLLLRLLGAGKTLRSALEDLKELPKDAPERRFLEQAMTQSRFAMNAVGAEALTQEELIMWKGQKEYEAYEKARQETIRQAVEQGLQQGLAQGLQQGVAQGLQQGVAQTLERLMSRRLGRPLESREQGLLRERIALQQSDAIADMLVSASVEELEAWLRGLAQ